MSRISEVAYNAFQDELQKEAISVHELLGPLARKGVGHAIQAGLGSGAGLGALAGAGIGGVSSGAKAYHDARDQGAGVTNSVLYGLSSGVRGAASGAGKGALVGGGAGALVGAARPLATIQGTKALARQNNIVGSASRFGQRQVHGFTGWTPGGSKRSLETIRGGAFDARKGLEAAALGGDVKSQGAALKRFHSSNAAQEMGLTNLPGIAKSIKNNGLKNTMVAGAKEQWDSMGPGMKALAVGFPAASVAGAALTPEEAGGPGRGERVGRALGALGYTAAPLPLGAGMALGSGLERVGALAGRGIDKLRRRPESAPVASQPGDTGINVPTESVYGSGFTGQPAELQ